jgi:hypothetical protein
MATSENGVMCFYSVERIICKSTISLYQWKYKKHGTNLPVYVRQELCHPWSDVDCVIFSQDVTQLGLLLDNREGVGQRESIDVQGRKEGHVGGKAIDGVAVIGESVEQGQIIDSRSNQGA